MGRTLTTWEEALKRVRKGGTVREFGGCPPGTAIRVETVLLRYDEIELQGSVLANPTDLEKH